MKEQNVDIFIKFLINQQIHNVNDIKNI